MEKTYDADSWPHCDDDDDVKPLLSDEATTMAQDILELRAYKCNDWELKFLHSIQLWEGQLTKPQTKTLNRIYDRVMR